MKRKLAAVVGAALTMVIMAGCTASTDTTDGQMADIQENVQDVSNDREEMTYMSSDGYQVRYYGETVESMEIDEHSVQFVYTAESSGTNMLVISYITDKQPEEALYDLTSAWGDQESIKRSEGFMPGTDDKWGYWRTLDVADTESGLGECAIAGEYNGGVLMFELTTHASGDDAVDIPASDTLSAIIDSILYDNYEEQSMYSYYSGTYVFENEMLVLNEDHHGTLSIQDDIDIIWGTNYIEAVDGSFTYNIIIEGENLYLDYDGNQIEMKKQ